MALNILDKISINLNFNVGHKIIASYFKNVKLLFCITFLTFLFEDLHSLKLRCNYIKARYIILIFRLRGPDYLLKRIHV